MDHHHILRVATKLLIPPIMLFALYVQFHGDFGPGGGFQAGVIMAAAFILYALVFGLETAQKVAPVSAVAKLVGAGFLIYMSTGIYSLIMGQEFLNYYAIAHGYHGQHYGIIAVEFGVLVTVASTMIMIFYMFAGRKSDAADDAEDTA